MKNNSDINKLGKSLNTSKYVLLATNIIASILFLVAYSLSKEIWFLIIGIALIAVCIFTILILKKLQNKLNSINKNQ